MSQASILSRRPGLDPGPRFLGEASAEETAGPRIKSGATREGKGQLSLGGMIEALRRRAPGWSLPARHATVLQSLPLGPGSRLIVVEFAGRRLLVGQSRAGLSLLADAAAEAAGE